MVGTGIDLPRDPMTQEKVRFLGSKLHLKRGGEHMEKPAAPSGPLRFSAHLSLASTAFEGVQNFCS